MRVFVFYADESTIKVRSIFEWFARLKLRIKGYKYIQYVGSWR